MEGGLRKQYRAISSQFINAVIVEKLIVKNAAGVAARNVGLQNILRLGRFMQDRILYSL